MLSHLPKHLLNNHAFLRDRYVESVTPVLGSLHPSAILDSLHWKCVQELKQQAAERGEVARDDVVDDLDGVGADERDSKMSCVQVMFSLSKVHPHTTLLAIILSDFISVCL